MEYKLRDLNVHMHYIDAISILNLLSNAKIGIFDEKIWYLLKWKWKVKVKSLSRVRLFETPMDCNPPDSSIHGIF